MPRAFVTVLLALGVLVAGLGPAASDLVITLKDGRVVRVPVEADQIQSLTFEEKQGGASQGQDAAPSAAAPSAAATSAAATVATGALVPTVPPLARPSGAAPIQVGPSRKLKVPSQAARIAKDGDIVEIDAGTYSGDVASWPQSNLTIRGVGGLAHVDAAGNNAEGKAVWVIKGDNVTIENVELSGCHVPDLNGAGIRLEGANFTLRGSFIHDNQMGILTGQNPRSDILIENSEFARNTVDYQKYGSLGHNVYIGAVRSFTLRGSYVHLASIGHNVKTRAATNYILYNRIMDEGSGNSSYLVDLSGGGNAFIVGNLFHKSAAADNNAMIAYAAETGKDKIDAEFYVVNNTGVADLREAVFVRNMGASVANAVNNIFIGGQTIVEGPGVLHNNVVGKDAGLRDTGEYDYRLDSDSPAVDVGIDPVTDGGISLAPVAEYRHPMSLEPRKANGPVDVGAYEAAAD